MNWNEVKEERDIQQLLEQFGYFHDSCLKELYLWTGSYVNKDLSMAVPGNLDTNVRILFQRQFQNPSAIELVFEGVTSFHMVPSPEGYDSIIMDAIILLYQGLIYWADAYDWHPENKNFQANSSWISAKNLKWRDVSSWMGKENRYGLIDED